MRAADATARCCRVSRPLCFLTVGRAPRGVCTGSDREFKEDYAAARHVLITKRIVFSIGDANDALMCGSHFAKLLHTTLAAANRLRVSILVTEIFGQSRRCNNFPLESLVIHNRRRSLLRIGSRKLSQLKIENCSRAKIPHGRPHGLVYQAIDLRRLQCHGLQLMEGEEEDVQRRHGAEHSRKN